MSITKGMHFEFLNKIQIAEKLNISRDTLLAIQHMFKSDIRSMINFLQSNHTPTTQLIKGDIITSTLWEELINHLNRGGRQFCYRLYYKEEFIL